MKKSSVDEGGSLDVSFDQSYPGSPVRKIKAAGVTAGESPTLMSWTKNLVYKNIQAQIRSVIRTIIATLSALIRGNIKT